MIEAGDLSLPATVVVHYRTSRTWRTLWLRRRRRRIVFAGFIERIERHSNRGSRVVVEDACSRLERRAL